MEEKKGSGKLNSTGELALVGPVLTASRLQSLANAVRIGKTAGRVSNGDILTAAIAAANRNLLRHATFKSVTTSVAEYLPLDIDVSTKWLETARTLADEVLTPREGKTIYRGVLATPHDTSRHRSCLRLMVPPFTTHRELASHNQHAMPAHKKTHSSG